MISSSRLSFYLIGDALECPKIAPFVSVKVVRLEMTEYCLFCFCLDRHILKRMMALL